MTLKEALHQLCHPQLLPDDLIEACKCLCHKDLTSASTDSAVHTALRLVAVPRLLNIISEPPANSQRPIDTENWVVFWAIRAVGECVSQAGLEEEAVRRGGMKTLKGTLDEANPETCCVGLKAIALLSAGYAPRGDGEFEDPEEYVSREESMVHFEQTLEAVTQILKKQRQTKRSLRHPFLLPLSSYALAFMASNSPPNAIDWTATCKLFSDLLTDNETDCAEAILILADSMVAQSEETRAAAISTGFLKTVLIHIARGDFQGDLATQSFTLLSAICDSGPQGAELLREVKGMKALSKTLTDLKSPKEQQTALKIAFGLLQNPEDPEGTLDKAVREGIVVEAFLSLTEAKDLETRQAALNVIDHVIRNASPKTYNSMKIDPYFVLSLLALTKTDPKQPDTLKFARQIAALVIWMGKNQRCNMDELCSTGNYSTAARIQGGMDAMSLAKSIQVRVKADLERERERARRESKVGGAKVGSAEVVEQSQVPTADGSVEKATAAV